MRQIVNGGLGQMSEAPQGPGWWQASDGRWYPPHTHPAYQPPPPPVAPRGSGVPKGLLIAGAVLLSVLVLGFAAASWALGRLGDKVSDSVGGDCELVSTQVVDSTLEGEFDVFQLGGLTKIATPALDSRVLADATTCWATQNDADPGRLVRIARLQTGDAAQRFQQERTLARGVKEDRGGGLTVESQPYFNRDVSFGDEAFCTTTDIASSSGMLVRRGDVLIYVSMTSGNLSPQIDPSAAENGQIKFIDDDKHCTLAQTIAGQVR